MVLLAALLCVAGGKLEWFFDGTSWSGVGVQRSDALKVKGLGKELVLDAPELELAFGAETWSLTDGGAPWLSGRWSRKAVTKRRVVLELSPEAAAALERERAERVAALAAGWGLVDPAVDATLVKARGGFGLKNEKGGDGPAMVSGRLALRLTFSGTVTGLLDGETVTRPWREKLRVKARTPAVPRDDVALPPDVDTTPPVADFLLGQTSGVAPFTVGFLSTSSGHVTSHAWDFGDGSSSSVPDPVHVFTDPGQFVVSLEVSGPFGSDRRERLVSVTGEPTTLQRVFPVSGVAPLLDGSLADARLGGPDGVVLQRPLPGGGDPFSHAVFSRPVGEVTPAGNHYEVHLAASSQLGSGQLEDLVLEVCVLLRRTAPEPDELEFLVEPRQWLVDRPPPPLGGPAPLNNIDLVTLGPVLDAEPDDVVELHVLNVSAPTSGPSDADLLFVRLDDASVVLPVRPAGEP